VRNVNQCEGTSYACTPWGVPAEWRRFGHPVFERVNRLTPEIKSARLIQDQLLGLGQIRSICFGYVRSARRFAATKMQSSNRGLAMDWAKHGVKIVHSDELDLNTPQTSGMTRAAAITHARAGANKLWAGTMVVQPDAKTGPHHHGELETVLYVVKGRVRMRWGDQLEFSEEARPGDFIYVPPYVPHQEINASPDEICEAVVVRDGQIRLLSI
jgi:uncharacterized RmlC-like cupin family protein